MPSRRTDLPLYLGLYEDIKDRIVSGELAAGEKLPSIRAMARDLRVSINTVNNAYYQLEVEGYVRPAERQAFDLMEHKERAYLIGQRPTVETILGYISRSSAMLSMRLHCSLLHMVLGRPAVGLNYNDKIEAQ